MKDLTASSGYIGDYTKTTASEVCAQQCCGSGMFLPDIGSRIKDPGSRIQFLFFHPRLRADKIPDPDPQKRIYVIFYPSIRYGMFILDPGS